MAAWKEMVLSGSAGDLSSLSLGTALGGGSGGTSFSSFTAGDLITGGNGANVIKLGVPSPASNIKRLKVAEGPSLAWEDDSVGSSLDSLSSLTTDTLSVVDGSADAELAITASAVADSGTALATGDQIHDFFTANFNNNAGSVTNIIAGSVAQANLTLTAATDGTTRSLTLGGSLANLDNGRLTNSSLTIGSTTVSLGNTQTAFAGLTGLDFTAADASIAAGIGANTLTIGGGGAEVSNSEILFAGNLIVAGTASYENTDNLRVKDKVFVVGSGSNNNTGGFLVQQAIIGGGQQESGQFFGFKYDASYGTNAGRYGFASGKIDDVEAGTVVPVGTAARPFTPTVVANTSAPSTAPLYGGTNGQGELHVNTSTERAYVYI
jgi:hypothetical protein